MTVGTVLTAVVSIVITVVLDEDTHTQHTWKESPASAGFQYSGVPSLLFLGL